MNSVANIDVVEENRAEARVSECEAGDNANANNEEKEKDVRASEVELHSVASGSEASARVFEGGGSEDGGEHGTRVSEESGVDKEILEKSGGFEVGNRNNSSFVQFDTESENLDQEDDQFDGKGDEIEDSVARVSTKGEVYNSLLSEFDDFVANEKNEALVGTSRALSYGFEVGDMVWGKVKSHPFWPGHIFNEAFASSSVRRTRREGHVLVAFFGDSSYGWFDPAELIPFDRHFAEKSEQTNSRTFVKAVEEAVDEASRRSALGLVCKCRNRYNFRPTDVQGYLAVDVPDYEAGGVYSLKQIENSRGEFRPGDTLNFVKQVALGPQECDQTLIDFIKNKAMVYAYRKAVFEEFDETYAQAFGPPSSKASKDVKSVSERSVKEPARAPPLSGPLVIAEALGSVKSSKKPIKVKDHSKKDKYLLKRRDEPVDSKPLQVGLKQSDSSDLAAYVQDSSTPTGGDYILQKRVPDPQISAKQEQTGLISGETSGPGEDSSGKEPMIIDQVPGYNIGPPGDGAILDGKQSLDKESCAQQDATDEKASTVVVGPTITVSSDKSVKSLGVADPASSFPPDVGVVDLINQANAKASKLNEGSQQSASISISRADADNGLDNSQDGQASSRLSPLNAKNSVGVGPDGVVKKTKVLKRPFGELSAGQPLTGEKKKKKKKDMRGETGTDRPRKRLSTGKVGVLAGKSSQDSSIGGGDAGVNIPSALNNIGTFSMVGVGNTEPELPQLLNDLHALALDPFHGVERNGPYIAVRFFLRFRSLVYQKSLVLSSQSESESVDARSTKSLSGVGASDNSADANARNLKPSKVSSKSLGRPDDPTIVGRKRLPSDRQEEIAAKRLKKINRLKSLAAEKKVGQKSLETPRAEGKESVAAALLKPAVRTDHVKKMPPKAVEPTMLVIKFPPGYNLPSVAELKARFARFGSIDQSAIRVLWKSSTCRVVFRHKSDAQAAYRYAIRNTSLFGNVDVRYLVREVGTTTEAPEPDKGRPDDTSTEVPRVKDPVYDRPTPPLAPLPLPQSAVQLKSILKKPPSSGDEAGQVTNGGNGGRGTSRVKFMLGGEESSRGDQMNRNNFNNNNNGSFGDGGGAPTSVAMDINSKNFQKVIPPPSTLPPILPTPPPSQFSKPSLNKSQYHTEGPPPRNMQILSHGPSPSPTIDISQQMLSLLTRCNDVVTGVRGLLGYVPYHPL